MSSDATITETCSCGTTLRIVAWAPHALSARRDFAAEHAGCRPKVPRCDQCGEPLEQFETRALCDLEPTVIVGPNPCRACTAEGTPA